MPDVTPLYAPTAKVLQLAEQIIADEDELVFDRLTYGFARRVRWKTIVEFYADARFETMPQQLLRLQEFVLHKDEWEEEDVRMIEEFFDAHKGAAYPFFFTAPDTGETHEVRFRDDSHEYSVVSALSRGNGDLVLVEAGDLDNSVNTGLVYPAYVASTTTSSSTTTSTSTGPGTTTTFSTTDTITTDTMTVEMPF